MKLLTCLFYLCFRIEAYYLNGPGLLHSLRQTALQPIIIWERVQINSTPIYKPKTGVGVSIIHTSPMIIFWPVFLKRGSLSLTSSSSSFSSSREEDFGKLKLDIDEISN